MHIPKGDYRDMWVFAEHHNGQLEQVTLEMLGEARRLMDAYNVEYEASENVVAVLPGRDVGSMAQAAIKAGADVVYTCDHEELAVFRLEPFTQVVGKMATGKDEYKDYDKPRYFLFPASNNGRDLSATVLGYLDSGLASDCNHLEIKTIPIKHPVKTRIDGEIKEVIYERILHMKRPDFSGFEWSTILCIDDPDKDYHPQACSIIPGSFAPIHDDGREGRIVAHEFDIDAKFLRVKVRSRTKLAAEADLTPFDAIVAMGRGIQPDPTKALKAGLELARVLQGDLGITRGIVTAQYTVDASVDQYTREARQIGETGQTVEPKLYVALGVSGAIQHKKGMDKSKFIVSVNTDENAPIREFSDVFVKGDLFDVAPKIVAKLKGGADA